MSNPNQLPQEPPKKLIHPMYEPPPPEQPAPPSQPQAQPLAIPRSEVLFTYVLLGLNILVFVVDTYLLENFLTYLGFKENTLIRSGEYWRLVTPIFLHGGLTHLFFNSYSLWMLGPSVERSYGRLRFLGIYFLSGIA